MKKPTRSAIPRQTIYRLSTYLRCLARLKQNSIRTVSSEALAKAAGVKSTQLRKDLTCFGQFGTRGLGYDVEQLSRLVSDLLGTNSTSRLCSSASATSVSRSLSYRGFEQGFEVIAGFDSDLQRKRNKQVRQPLYPMDKLPEVIRDRAVRLAVLTVPPSEAQEVARRLVECGITGILNFAPVVLEVPEEVMVNNVNLAIELEHLCYFVQQ
ncbi:MAG: redox-sensing transcriptional repressor Rex [Verrucomicrobiota bacterium]